MKKIKIIIVSVVAVTLCIVIPLILNKGINQRKIEALQQEQNEKDKQAAILNSDLVAPILILTQDKVVLYQGDELNYELFIKEASDNLEGDLTNKVIYETLDTSKIGDYYIDYEISDTALNTTKARLQVIIREKPNFKY